MMFIYVISTNKSEMLFIYVISANLVDTDFNKYIQEETQFLIDAFPENCYDINTYTTTAKEYFNNRNKRKRNYGNNDNNY